MTRFSRIFGRLRRTVSASDGNVTVEFVLIFPAFFFIFLMILESGMIGMRHVMLEHGTEIAVRDVRLGRIYNSDPALFKDAIRKRICEEATTVPDCENQLQIEMIRRSPRSWSALPTEIQCIDRSAAVQPSVGFTNGGNNDLMFLRVCARIDPWFPTTGIGKAIADANDNSAAGGSLALVSHAAFVVEPFQ